MKTAEIGLIQRLATNINSHPTGTDWLVPRDLLDDMCRRIGAEELSQVEAVFEGRLSFSLFLLAPKAGVESTGIIVEPNPPLCRSSCRPWIASMAVVSIALRKVRFINEQ